MLAPLADLLPDARAAGLGVSAWRGRAGARAAREGEEAVRVVAAWDPEARCLARSAGPAAEPPQWRKWRRPVKTMARWWRSAISMAISSRTLPPGWMMAVTPRSAARAMASPKGK